MIWLCGLLGLICGVLLVEVVRLEREARDLNRHISDLGAALSIACGELKAWRISLQSP